MLGNPREKGRSAEVENWHPVALAPRRIALVARDWIGEAAAGYSTFADPNMGLQPHIRAIMKTCDAAHCDTVLCAPWTNNVIAGGSVVHGDLFPTGTKHSTVVMGNCLTSWRDEWIEVWSREFSNPIRFAQIFSTSDAPIEEKRRFVEHLHERILGDIALVVCGEINILHLLRDDRIVVDRFKMLPVFAERNVHVVLNPVHDYTRRYEMPLKRRALSEGRMVVSVWNRVCKDGGEAANPWQVFLNHQDVSDEVEEVDAPAACEHGVRIGVARVNEGGKRA